MDDGVDTDSQNVTVGSATRMSQPLRKSSFRSFRHTSKCSSPQPAMMCSPVLLMNVCTSGSDFTSRRRPDKTRVGQQIDFTNEVQKKKVPALSLLRLRGSTTATARRTMGDTVIFMQWKLCAVVSVV